MEHDKFLKQCIDLAWSARRKGNHPFGALIADETGAILLSGENTVNTGNDVTGHAELNVVREASAKFSREVLSAATLYTSTEPCPMCCGAIYWAGIRKVVFALSGPKMYTYLPESPKGMRLHLPCRDVFSKGDESVEVTGPMMEEKAGKVHEGFWI